MCTVFVHYRELDDGMSEDMDEAYERFLAEVSNFYFTNSFIFSCFHFDILSITSLNELNMN